jgi:SPP1 gp7 family putative phage head morphogenesis protein
VQFNSWGRLVDLYQRRILHLVRLSSANRSAEWDMAVRKVAEDMAREVAKTNARSWREAAMKSTRARQIFAALQAEIHRNGIGLEIRLIADQNAKLIKSLPSKIAQHLNQRAVELQQQGARPAVIASEIRQYAPLLTKNQVQLLARTSISTAETEMTRVRAQRIGITHYQWSTSQDSRVRESHRNMNGVIVAWNDPPNPEKLIGQKSTSGPYAAGCTYQCRCVALPLADLSEVSWPCRVFAHGSIRRMSRQQFSEVAGVTIAA